jgi:hypothetical protein
MSIQVLRLLRKMSSIAHAKAAASRRADCTWTHRLKLPLSSLNNPEKWRNSYYLKLEIDINCENFESVPSIVKLILSSKISLKSSKLFYSITK